MAGGYGNDQPQGFSNRIEKVAIVGVRRVSTPNASAATTTTTTRALVLIITMSVAAPSDNISKLVRAAAKAGVPYVLPNWFGHDAANSTLICTEIESLGISSYLLLVCNFWYEFSLGGRPDGFDFKKRSFVLFDDGNTDRSPTLSQFRDGSIYISSFRLSQRDMFESVKRGTGTTDADWTITHESAEQCWKDGQAALQQGNMNAFTKMLYSRTPTATATTSPAGASTATRWA
ncbi:hypothetical protein V1506DRAFT_550960 [Lipomyces tetrasporus]